MVACGDPGGDDAAPRRTTSTPSAASTSVSPESSIPPTGPPATRGPRTITFGPITFHVPSAWDIDVRQPDTAYVGVLAGGPADVFLRVMTNYTGTVDALQPTDCLGEPTTPASTELLESGFAAVGGRTAEYRRWRLSCPEGDLEVEDLRVWLLPISHIAIVEQRPAPEVADVVTTAEAA